MKVAIVTHFPADPNAPHGGVEALSVNMVRALSQLDDMEIHVVTREAGRSHIEITPWAGATVHRLPRGDGWELTDAVRAGRRQLHKYLLKLAPDVVHAHDTYGLMVKGLSIPRVFTINGFIYGDTLVSGKRLSWLRSQIWRWVETSGWADQPYIISVSPYVRECLTGIATGIIYDIDNPISESFFQIDRNERKGVIFSAAVISPRKNTITLVESFAHLVSKGCNAELRLAGDITEPGYGRSLRELIHKYGLGDKVTLLGRISTDQVLKELSIASVFALVSLEENSPVGIEEAMAAGVPVVTSNRCGMPYMVQHGESGFLVNPLDTDDIVRRLKQLIENDTLRGTMGERSRLIALDRFHPKSVACRTREVYFEAIQNKGTICNR